MKREEETFPIINFFSGDSPTLGMVQGQVDSRMYPFGSSIDVSTERKITHFTSWFYKNGDCVGPKYNEVSIL